jgi:hypothetical protein
MPHALKHGSPTRRSTVQLMDSLFPIHSTAEILMESVKYVLIYLSSPPNENAKEQAKKEETVTIKKKDLLSVHHPLQWLFVFFPSIFFPSKSTARQQMSLPDSVIAFAQRGYPDDLKVALSNDPKIFACVDVLGNNLLRASFRFVVLFCFVFHFWQ